MVIWEMAERFGWSLEYVEGLSMARLHEWTQIQDGRSKGQEARAQKNRFHAAKGGKH